MLNIYGFSFLFFQFLFFIQFGLLLSVYKENKWKIKNDLSQLLLQTTFFIIIFYQILSTYGKEFVFTLPFVRQTFYLIFCILIIQDKINECPILKPHEKQFRNFLQFVTWAEIEYRNDFGMVRVIPPKSWKPSSNQTKLNLDKLTVNGPIQQNIFGKGGIYETILIQKKSMTLREYKQKVIEFDRMSQGLTGSQVESKVKLFINQFWKNIGFSPPLYGADIHNSLMDSKAGGWDLNQLQSVIKYSIENKCKGVNTPYLYVGSWKTFFAWHKEDLDLSAINYMHQGKSKYWYSIPPNQSHLLEKVAKKYFPQHFAQCSEHLRHKNSLMNPYLLKQQCPELKICKSQHKKNQFILVFGGAYHTGFNSGFNIAEAVNYATTHWLQQVTEVKHCKCEDSSVKVNLLELKNTIQKSPLSKMDEFKRFSLRVSEMQREEIQEQAKLDQIKKVKSVFSKKIKKNPKSNVNKISYKGQKYQIENWAQCEKCKIWRKTNLLLQQSQHFFCKAMKKKCHQKQREKDKRYIIL